MLLFSANLQLYSLQKFVTGENTLESRYITAPVGLNGIIDQTLWAIKHTAMFVGIARFLKVNVLVDSMLIMQFAI